jgi:hypothetical protein
MSKRLRNIEEEIITNADLTLKAFNILKNYRSNKINRNILELPEDLSRDALQILNASRVFRDLNLPENKLKNLYEQSIQMQRNPEIIEYYTNIQTKEPTDVAEITKFQPRKQLNVWFERFTQKQTALPVYKIEPNQINTSVLNPAREKQSLQCRRDIANSIMFGDLISDECLDPNLLVKEKTEHPEDPEIIENFEIASNLNGCILRDEILQSVSNFENFELGNTVEPLDKSDIPIYFIVIVGGEQRGHHMVLYILCKNLVYTIGLGFYGDLEGKYVKMQNKLNDIHPDHYFGISALYTPDYMLNLERKKNFKNSIIDIGILRTKHIDVLQTYLSKIKTIHISYFYHETDKTLQFSHTYLTGTSQIYSKISNRFLVDNYINCTSFITHIFPHVRCRYFRFFRISPDDPRFCTTNPKLTNEDIETIFQYFLSDTPESFQELLQYLKQREILTHRGGKGKRKTRKSNSRKCRNRRHKNKTKTKR